MILRSLKVVKRRMEEIELEREVDEKELEREEKEEDVGEERLWIA